MRATWYRDRRRRILYGRGNAAWTLVEVTGSRRRVQALCCLGYSLREQGRRVGMQQGGFRRVLRVPAIRQATVDRIRVLYEKLWDTPAESPTARRVRQAAKRQGWFPPQSWDDEDIDNPDAVPSVPKKPLPGKKKTFDERAVSFVVDERVPMRLVGVDRMEARRRLYARGVPDYIVRDLTNGIRPIPREGTHEGGRP